MPFAFSQRIGAEFPGPFRHLVDRGGELVGIGGPEVEHLESLPFYSRLPKQFARVPDPPLGLYISFQEMAVAFLSAGDQDRVRTGLEGLEQMGHVHPAGAHEFHDPYVRGIFQPE